MNNIYKDIQGNGDIISWTERVINLVPCRRTLDERGLQVLYTPAFLP